MSVTNNPTDATARERDYCRRARRLRGRLRDQPVRLHRELAGLKPVTPHAVGTVPRGGSVRMDGTVGTGVGVIRHPTPTTVCPAILLGVSVDRERSVRRFVDHVRATLGDTGLLTLHQRRGLLGVAAKLGVERFHANLAIAALLHESGRSRPTRATPAPPRDTSNPPRWGVWAAAVVVQAVIGGGAVAAWAWVGR